MQVKAYLQVIMTIDPENRPAAAKVYNDYRQPFLDTVEGALTKECLIRGKKTTGYACGGWVVPPVRA